MDATSIWIACISATGVVFASSVAWVSNRANLRAAERRETSLREQLSQQREDDLRERAIERTQALELARVQHSLELDRLRDDRGAAQRAVVADLRRSAHLAALNWFADAFEQARQLDIPVDLETDVMGALRERLTALRAPLDLYAGDPSTAAFNTAVESIETMWMTWQRYRNAVMGSADYAVHRKEARDSRLAARDAVERYRLIARADIG